MRLPILFLALATVARAQFGFPNTETPDLSAVVRADLVASVTTIAPGKPFEVALRLDHSDGWHTYYLNPGQVGNPPAIEWTLPKGFKVSPMVFPVPDAGTFSGATFYGYHGQTFFITTITPPEVLPEEGVTIKAGVSWLACKEQCIPGNADLVLRLATGPDPVTNAAAAGEFAKARAQQPLDRAPWSLRGYGTGDEIVIDLHPAQGAVADLKDVRFFSSDRQDNAQKPQSLTRLPDSSGWRLTIPRAKEDTLGEPIPQLPHVSGILRSASGWTDGNPAAGLLVHQLALEPSPAPVVAGQTTAPEPSGLPVLAVFALMFVGGLILNLMPCVFPVIGLKIMGFVQQAGSDREQVIRHGMVFAAGVLVSFWVLAGLLLAGGIRGWGSQLENPWVVFSLILVMLALAMSMYGVFEIGASATGIGGSLTQKEGFAGSFFSGVLATVVATPCSAPILATGLSAAVQLPPLPFMVAFTFMAAGLSTPYLFLSIYPALVNKLPRPGPWMESFKQGMSFLLFGTVGYLLWLYAGQVFDQHAGQKGLWVVIGLSTVAAGLWVYGRWCLPHRAPRVRWTGRAVAALLLAAGILAAKPEAPPADDPAELAVPELEWQPWSADLQQKLLAEGRPVYVDFTARWCLTCQTNKAAAYTAEVRKILQQAKVATLRADKTTANPAVDAELRRLGKAAIPVNVLHLPGDPVPRFTNTVLTSGYLADFLHQHLPGSMQAPE